MPLNLYLPIATMRSRLNLSGTSYDSQIEESLERASRYIDSICHRPFYVETASNYFDTGSDSGVLLLSKDVLTVSGFVTDSEADGTYDGETWTQNTDYWLAPDNRWPKTYVQATPFGGKTFPINTVRYVKITGTFGYGDGTGSSPWLATAVTGTVATTDGLTLTISVSAGITAGTTILVESEQMYVSSVTTTSATVVRGVNGTTAATHSAKTIYTAVYPSLVCAACQQIAGRYFRETGETYASEGIGDYRRSRFTPDVERLLDKNMLSQYIRMF